MLNACYIKKGKSCWCLSANASIKTKIFVGEFTFTKNDEIKNLGKAKKQVQYLPTLVMR